MFTIRHYKRDFTNLRVAIVGDVLHSRVARSQIHALTTLGVPGDPRDRPRRRCCRRTSTTLGVHVYHDMREGSEGRRRGDDAAAAERAHAGRAAAVRRRSSYKFYGLTAEKLALAKPDAIVLHPGPMNRGVEIDSSVADGRQSVILPQVTFGIAIRMAVMSIIGGN